MTRHQRDIGDASDRRAEHGASRPPHEGYGVVTGEAGDVGQPCQRFDPGRAADGDGESTHLRAWQLWLQWCEGFFEPLDHASLPEWQLRSLLGIGVE